jgi:hypothetical protein
VDTITEVEPVSEIPDDGGLAELDMLGEADSEAMMDPNGGAVVEPETVEARVLKRVGGTTLLSHSVVPLMTE